MYGVPEMRWLAALVAVAAGVVAARVLVVREVERGMIKTRRQSQKTPRAPFEALQVVLPDRTLNAFYVPADGPGLLIFHGNEESISSWSSTLDLLHENGIAAMVFDYSGFGASGGAPTLAHFHDDAVEAWHVFRTRLPGATRACAYGLSLGTAVLLEAAPELTPPPDCIALSGAFLSAREAAVQLHRLQRWQSWLLPDVLDSLENVARVKGPLLIEHGAEDELFPPAWAAKLAAARPGAQVEIVRGMRHADPVARPSPASWDPVIRFVKATPQASRRGG